MQLDDWSTYRETLLYVRELALLFPSLWSELLSENSVAATSSLLSHPTSLVSLASVKQVEAPFLMQWMAAAATVSVAYHCKSTGDHVEDVDHAAAVVVAHWTRLLGMWIALRVELLCSTSGAVLIPEEEKELERYRQYFVPLAWPMLDQGIRERLVSHLCALAEKQGARQPMCSTSCASDIASSCVAVLRRDEEDEQKRDEVCTRAMEATQRVAREYLRISWDVLRPSSVPATVDAKLKRLSAQQSQRNVSEAVGSTPRSAVVHTNCLGDLLQALERLQLRPQRQHVDLDLAPWLTLTQTALLHIGYDLLTKVRASLVERCYYLIPAVLDYELCVHLCEVTLPESAGLQAHEKELTRVQGILRLTLQSLLQSAIGLYQHTIEVLLVGYNKKSTATLSASLTPRLVKLSAHLLPKNPLVTQEVAQNQHTSDAVFVLEPTTHPCATGGVSASAVMRLSGPAFAVLVEVLEPTCDLLQRYPADWNGLSARSLKGPDGRDQGATRGAHRESEGGLLSPPPRQQHLMSWHPRCSTTLDARRELMSFLEAKMSSCFADAAAGSGAAAKKAQRQATTDAYLLVTYLSTYGPHWL
ncbi:hypothetical protein Q4I30_007560 [Leishmania utingensis]|uniref:Uncharacterized protein n=1 Tax=Leishmania utingensis TaxID=653362 RepID=A0AAW2ZZW8_9TRYP